MQPIKNELRNIEKPIRMQIWGFAVLSLLAYVFLIYFTPRQHFIQFFALFSLLFFGYACVVKPFSKPNSFSDNNFKILVALGVFFRVILLFNAPSFSDDFYRFYWDGLLLSNQISPFQYLPSELVNGTITLDILGINTTLFLQLNSPNYYSIYPPVCQAVNFCAAFLFPNNIFAAVVVMKLAMLAFELGSLFFFIQLLKRFGLPVFLVLIYWLNPLVITELVGNIHYEAGMLCFMLGSLCFFSKSKVKMPIGLWNAQIYMDKYIVLSALFFSLAVATKLIPLMFLPFVFTRLGIVTGSIYTAIVLGLNVLFFMPMVSFEIIQNLFSSIELYFAKFEFNASLYYLARWIGFQVKGWNMIATIGAWFSKLVFVFIVLKALTEKNATLNNLPKQWLWALLVYLLFATVVHPWYIIPLLGFSIFTKFRFTVAWSYLILLSYHTYITEVYQELLPVVALEYGLLLVFVLGYKVTQFVEKKQFYEKEKG